MNNGWNEYSATYNSDYQNNIKRYSWHDTKNADRINAWLADKGK